MSDESLESIVDANSIENNSDFDWSDIPETVEVSEESSEDSEPAADSEEPAETLEAGSEEGEKPAEEESLEASEEVSEEEKALELPESVTAAGIVQQEGELGKMVKVDGEEKFVSLKDLGNEYSGQLALQRRFSEFDRKEKTWQEQVNSVNSYINTFREKMQGEEGSLSAMQYLGELSGLPPYMVREQLIQSLMPELERRAGMSALELQNELLKEQTDYLQNVRKSEEHLLQEKKAYEELQTRANSYRETHNITQNEWEAAVSYLKEHPNMIGAEQLKNPEIISNFIRYDRAEKVTENVIRRVDEKLLSNDALFNTAMDQLYNNPDFTEQDLEELIKGVVESDAKAKASEKLTKKVEKKVIKQPEQKRESQSKEELIPDWDDL